jgi:hypothetical protein
VSTVASTDDRFQLPHTFLAAVLAALSTAVTAGSVALSSSDSWNRPRLVWTFILVGHSGGSTNSHNPSILSRGDIIAGGSGGGSVGLLSNLRQYLWIPITQNAFRRISLDLFSHMLDLDLHFHLHRKTGRHLFAANKTSKRPGYTPASLFADALFIISTSSVD